MSASQQRKWLALALLCAVQFMVVLDIAIVNVALPPSRSTSASPREPAVGDQRVRARLRGLPPARGSRRGSPRASARVHGRPRRLLDRIAPVRSGLVRGLADRRPRDPGARRRGDHAGRPVHPDHHVQGRPRAQHRPRRVGRGGRFRRSSRRPLRRDPHRSALVGVDLLRERARRHRGARAGAGPALREPCTRIGQGFDALGAILVTSGLSLFVLGITQGQSWGWGSSETIGVFIASAVLLLGFVAWESRGRIRSCPSRSSACRP